MEIALEMALVTGLPNFHDKRKWVQYKSSRLFTSAKWTLAPQRTADTLTLTIQQRYSEMTECVAQMSREKATLRRLL